MGVTYTRPSCQRILNLAPEEILTLWLLNKLNLSQLVNFSIHFIKRLVNIYPYPNRNPIRVNAFTLPKKPKKALSNHLYSKFEPYDS